MKRNRIIASLVTALILSGFGLTKAAVIGESKLVPDGRGYKAERTHEFKAKVNGKLELSDIVGNVTIDSWDENKVQIIENLRINSYTEEEAKRVLEDYTLKTDTRGDLIIATGPGNYRRYIVVEYTIMLPKKFSADISTAGGELKTSGLTGEFKFKTSGGDVEITDCEGSIEAATSGGDLELIRIKGILDASTSGGDIICHECSDDLKLKTSGGDIDLRKLSGSVVAKTSGGDINVVDIDGYCSVKTSGGDISLNRVKTNRKAMAETSGGDIDIVYIEGDLAVSTSGGDVRAEKVVGNLFAKTSGGDITTDDVKGNLEIATSGGDIEIRGAEGYIDASTSGGDVEAEIAKFFKKRDQHVILKSSGGDLELTLPADFEGYIEAVIKVYRADWEDYDIISDFPLSITRDMDDESKGKSARKWSKSGEIIGKGELNGGGDPIILETTNGNIIIRKK